MTTKNAFAGLLLAAIIPVFFFSCASSMKATIKDDGTQIPPGFGKKNEILLVIRKNKRSYDKYLEKNFEENYFGKYIIIDAADTLNSKYKNTDTYRYIFAEDYHMETPTYTAGQQQEATQRQMERRGGPGLDYTPDVYAKFQVTDRKSGVIYRTKHGTGAFSAWMKAYIQALENARKKN
jgi:hypothetical protein